MCTSTRRASPPSAKCEMMHMSSASVIYDGANSRTTRRRPTSRQAGGGPCTMPAQDGVCCRRRLQVLLDPHMTLVDATFIWDARVNHVLGQASALISEADSVLAVVAC